MAEKILMYVSTPAKNAVEHEYTCPDKTKVTGMLTNEAPVKYLLNKYPNIEELICICSAQVSNNKFRWFVNPATGMKVKLDDEQTTEEPVFQETSYEYLEKVWSEYKPGIAIKKIDASSDDDFESIVVPKILERIESGDCIHMETTGGFRNDVINLLLLNRVLLYKDVQIGMAVYSDFGKKEVRNISHLLRLFDLIEGMQNLTSLGNVKKLKDYYGEDCPKEIQALLEAMENLTENITLCRSDKIENSMSEFNIALDGAKNYEEPLMRTLLPIFSDKFGKDGKMDIVDLINWCLESNMYQQAITVYAEQIPKYILTTCKNQYLVVNDLESAGNNSRKLTSANAQSKFFNEIFLSMSQSTPLTRVENESQEFGIREMRAYLKECSTDPNNEIAKWTRNRKTPRLNSSVPKNKKTAILNICYLLDVMYPKSNLVISCLQRNWPSKLSREKKFLEKLKSSNTPSNLNKMLNHLAAFTDEALCTLMEIEYNKDLSEKKREGTSKLVNTIKNFDELIEKNKDKYRVVCDMEQMKTILRDYVYIRLLRNMTNHAASENIKENKADEAYLKEYEYKVGYYYPDLDNTNLEQIHDVLKYALEHLKL